MLRGGWLISPALLRGDGIASGPCVKRQSALATKRIIFASDCFQRDFAELWAHILGVAHDVSSRRQPMKWRFVVDAQQWAAHRARAMAGNRPREVLAIVTTAEVQQLGDEVGALDPEAFFSFISHEEDARGSVGFGGM
jgi:hypothetical protein